jgi:hypothetical protein
MDNHGNVIPFLGTLVEESCVTRNTPTNVLIEHLGKLTHGYVFTQNGTIEWPMNMIKGRCTVTRAPTLIVGTRCEISK